MMIELSDIFQTLRFFGTKLLRNFNHVNSRGVAFSSTHIKLILQFLLISALLIEVTYAASTGEINSKNAFTYNQETPSSQDDIVNVTCGASTSNDTFFVNQNYPSTDSSGGVCDLIVNKHDESICQIRIDFLTFDLAQPNSEGICDTDFVTVIGGSHSAPVLCGYNSGQHIYVDVAQAACSLKILVDMDSNLEFPRIFNMQITQIPYSSILRAPIGCLQYFTATSGTVKSFNFPSSQSQAETAISNGNTRQLSNTDYSACIRPEDGYRSINWSPDPDFAPFNFFVTYDENIITDSLFGNPQAVTTGEACTSDYIIIPNAQYTSYDGHSVSSDRFCGPAFPASATSTDLLFQLYVRTDGTESQAGDSGNIGFSLNFRQHVN